MRTRLAQGLSTVGLGVRVRTWIWIFNIEIKCSSTTWVDDWIIRNETSDAPYIKFMPRPDPRIVSTSFSNEIKPIMGSSNGFGTYFIATTDLRWGKEVVIA